MPQGGGPGTLLWGWTEVKGSAGASAGSQREGSRSTGWLKAGKGSRGSQEGAGLQNCLPGAEKQPGKCSWKALPEVLEEAEGVQLLWLWPLGCSLGKEDCRQGFSG